MEEIELRFLSASIWSLTMISVLTKVLGERLRRGSRQGVVVVEDSKMVLVDVTDPRSGESCWIGPCRRMS